MAKYYPKPVNMAQPQENFAEYYSFDKKGKIGPRERLVGVSYWDKKYGCCDDSSMPQTAAFKRGAPSKFSHTKAEGKLRTSGKGHRIGKR